MLVDELKKNYELYNRELTKEETEQLYGTILRYITLRLKNAKGREYWNYGGVWLKNSVAHFPGHDGYIKEPHFNSIVNYFRSEGLEVVLSKCGLIFKW